SNLDRLPPALALQLGLSTVCVAAVFIGAPLLPGQSPESVHGLQLYSLALLPLAFFTVFTTALRGKQRMDLYTILNLLVSLGQLLGVWLFVQPGSSVRVVAACLLVTQVAAAVLAGSLCAVYIPDFWRAWRFSFSAVLALARASAPIALLGLLGMTYQKLSVYMLATLTGAAMTGWFSASMRVVEAFKLIHLALFGALYPAMSQARQTKSAQSEATFRASGRSLLAVSTTAVLGLFAFASPLVASLYGPTFEPSIPALRILAWTLIPYTINTYLSLSFLAVGRERRVARALFASLLALTILNLWWIPVGGLVGACWAALAAEIIQSIFLVCQQWYSFKSPLSGEPERIS
ncbi:MAG TPA: polysaccharide biosynthesis C-terminal domain-containing protein, partial [Anaerolineales bacterium]|nr:polysaccharide biosynthesis C-terminal domain-containing protein [Anaerolineales bacterium]